MKDYTFLGVMVMILCGLLVAIFWPSHRDEMRCTELHAIEYHYLRGPAEMRGTVCTKYEEVSK